MGLTRAGQSANLGGALARLLEDPPTTPLELEQAVMRKLLDREVTYNHRPHSIGRSRRAKEADRAIVAQVKYAIENNLTPEDVRRQARELREADRHGLN